MASEAPLLGGNTGNATEAAAAVPQQREMVVLDPSGNSERNFANNSVSTTKYSFIPTLHFFVWKNLFEQFHKAANVYFLLISALQLIPGLSPTGRFTTLGPLCMVLLVTMAKDVFEDWKRLVSDRELNARPTFAWREGAWVHVSWAELRVGDLCKVVKGESFPADLILIWSTDSEGMCYIETANLDGETNLKIRKAVAAIYKLYSPGHPDSAGGRITCELPNNRLYNFDGFYEKPGKPKCSLTADNLLLRGANLRNTAEIVGMVVFTGAETKLMKNSSAKSSKMSRIDRITNKQILFVFLLLVSLCVSGTIAASSVASSMNDHWYLVQASSAVNIALLIFASFGTFLILFNNLIPISLYVTMEMVKLVQASLINTDLNMYYEETDTAALARTSSLNEELGQVEYIFSDKTGTLTCNMMDFLKFTTTKYDAFQQKEVVVSYGTGTTEIGRSAAAREGIVLKDDRPPGWAPKNGFFFYDPRISENQWQKEENAGQLENFFIFLAVCHAVIPERDKAGVLTYQAASPDEGCLVKAAREIGVVFLERTDSNITISVGGDVQKWDVLNVIEFDSTRKRMSVIVQNPKGKLLLLCKGADTVIYERLRKENRGTIQSDTLELLTKFAAEGLRTLVLGQVELDEPSYSKWSKRYNEASMSIVDRAKKMAAVAEEIEHNLELVGATAIEDKLQNQVPQTIELLSKAGIKIWVLTGDKQETAINIGFACALLHTEMGLFMFDDCSKDNVAQVLQCYVGDARGVTQQDLGLIIQGDILEHVLPKDGEEGIPHAAGLFLTLATRCRAVICCRVSPLQKASVVSLVKNNIDTVTLAIGDGANDVSMIQAAHVGIGISGLEGLQAARASDYSIAQFQYLKHLLLVHGRFNYRRISKLILYCFYKNVVLFLTQFWFALFNFFTGQSLYDQWGLSLYNMLFTAYPIIVFSILDKDVKVERLLSKEQFPELYHDGMKNLIFNTVSFWMYMVNAIVHSLICFFISLYAGQYFENADGIEMGLVGTGVLCYSAVLFTITAKIATETQSWTVPNAIVIFGSIAMWYVFLGFYGNLYAILAWTDFANWYGAPAMILTTATYWFGLFLILVVCLLRDVCWKVWRHNYSQKLVHMVQEFEHQNRKFSRTDVVRCAAHLLPKFQTLKPYEMNKAETSIFAEAEMALPTFQGVAKGIGSNFRLYLQDQTPKTQDTVKRAPLTGTFFSQPGKVKIRDIVLDEL